LFRRLSHLFDVLGLLVCQLGVIDMSMTSKDDVKDTVNFRIGRRVNNMLLSLARVEKRTKIGEMEFLAEKRCEELGISKYRITKAIDKRVAEAVISK
jgi:hypothetical protein